MSFWSTLHSALNNTSKLMLLYVLDSTGSSPGRQGFRMLVTLEGQMAYSIGGGVMEHKLVELSKDLLTKEYQPPFIKKQIHQTNIAKNKSGMICSGEQTIGFYQLSVKDLPVIENILRIERENGPGVVVLNQLGLFVLENINTSKHRAFEATSESEWSYMELINNKPTVYIIGGGHVGKALSRTMHQLDFRVEIFDDRQGLNTMDTNEFAHKKHNVPFDRIRQLIHEGDNSYVVVMTFGYKTDKQVLQHLQGIDVKYYGMMGSQTKVDKLYAELREEGHSIDDLARLHSPIGVQIHSKSPEEIAVSVAAEIIKVKNHKPE